MSAIQEAIADANRKWAEMQAQENTENETPVEAVNLTDPLQSPAGPMDDLPSEEPSAVEVFTEPVEVDPVEVFADQVASRLDLELVDVLALRIREQDLELASLRRVAAEAVIAAREATILASQNVPAEVDEESEMDEVFERFETLETLVKELASKLNEPESERRWWKFWRR